MANPLLALLSAGVILNHMEEIQIKSLLFVRMVNLKVYRFAIVVVKTIKSKRIFN